MKEVKDALELIYTSFVEAHGVSLTDEIVDAFDYARRYLALQSTDYGTVSMYVQMTKHIDCL